MIVKDSKNLLKIRKMHEFLKIKVYTSKLRCVKYIIHTMILL